MKSRLLFLLVLPLFAFTGDRSQAPLFTSTPVTSVKETELYQYLVDAEDADGDSFEFIAKVLPGWLRFGPDDQPRVSTFLTINQIEGNQANPSSREPKHIAADAHGNIYMADAGHHVVRKITPGGNVTTLAGSGQNKYQNGTGTQASFVDLQGIAVGPDGNIYISEAGKGSDGKLSHRVRKITPEGVVSNFVGREFIGDFDFHLGTSATFNTPMGLVFDSKGNLYIADSGNHNLRKVTPDGAVTTFAGIGEDPPLVFESGTLEGFASLEYLAVDSNDNIYVTTKAENRVLKVYQDGVIEVFSGVAGIGDTEDLEGTEQFIKYWEPMGIAIDRDDNVYITDMNMRVKRISPDGKRVRHLAGNGTWEHKDGISTQAAFQTPYSLTFDSFQNLYVAESGGHNLRRLSGSTLSGNPLGNAGIHDVSIEVVDSDGNSSTQDFQIVVTDETPPVLEVILRQTPTQEQLTGNEATFRVVFNEPVINVDPADFSIKADGAEGVISTVTMVDAKTYDVLVTGINLKKLLDLDLENSTDIENSAGFKIEEYNVTGVEETYWGPNTAPTFVTTPVTEAAEGEKYTYKAGATDIDGEIVGIFGVTIPDWLELQVPYLNTEIAELPSTLSGVTTTTDGGAYVGVVSDDFTGIKRVLPDETLDDFVGGASGFADGSGTAALFGGVDDIAIDPEGNMFVADGENRSIRKVDTDGNVTTLIGDGPGSGPSTLVDGDLAEATVKKAMGLVFNQTGDLFFTDAGFYKVRKIGSDGQVTTLAGNTSGFKDGTGTEARFGLLAGITMDPAGNLYVVDEGNHSIRRVTPEGMVTTLAGNGTKGVTNGKGENARFNAPTGITIDKGGNLYVADTGNGRIRKITPDGVVSHYEMSSLSLNAPERIAASNNGIFYITDAGLKKSRPYSPTLTGTPENVAGGIPVELIAADGFGASVTQSFTIVIPDGVPPVFTSGKAEIVAENVTGVIHTVMADDLAILTYSLGTTRDEGQFTIDQQTGEVSFLEAPDFENPTDANTNNVYEIEVIADDGSHQVSQLVQIKVGNLNDPPVFVSTPLTEVKESEVYLYDPLAEDDDNSFLIYEAVTLPDWLSLEKKPETEVETQAGSGTADKNNGGLENADFNHPFDLEFDLNGDLIVVDRDNHMVRKIGSSSVSTLAGNGIAGFKDDNGVFAQFNQPSGIAISPNGTIYIADAGNHIIREISSSGEVDTFTGDGTAGYMEGRSYESRFNTPMGMAVRGSDLYVADQQNHVIRKISNLGTVSTYAGSGSPGYQDGEATAAGFNLPTDIEFDSNGNLYVVDSGNNRIRKISTNGTVSTVAGSDLTGQTDGIEGLLDAPLGITIDAGDNIFFSESDSHLIRRISSTGLLTTWAGKGEAGATDSESEVATFNGPRGLAIDGAGDLLVADELNHKVRKVTSSEGGFQLIGAPVGQVGEHTVKLTASDGKVTVDQEFIINVIDGILPKLVSIKRESPVNEKLTTATAVFQVIFNEAMNDIETTDFTLKNENSGQVTLIERVSTTTFNITVSSIGDNTKVELEFHPDHEISDIFDNKVNRLLEATDGPDETFTGPDPLAIVSIKRHNPLEEQLTGNTAVFRVTFSEDVQAVEASYFEIKAGGATGTITQAVQGATANVYDITVSNVVGGRALDLDVSAQHDIKDLDGNVLNDIVPAEEETYTGVNSAPQFTSVNEITVYTDEAIDYNLGLSDLENDDFELIIQNAPDWLSYEAQLQYIVTRLVQISDPTDDAGRTSTADDPSGLVLDSDDNLYIIDRGEEAIKKITVEGNVSVYVDYSPIEHISPRFLEFDQNGNLIVAGLKHIYRLNDQNQFELLAGGGSGFADGTREEAKFAYINGMTLGDDGNLYVSDLENRRIRKVTQDGIVTTLAGSGPTSVGQAIFGSYFEDGDAETAKFSSPREIISDQNGSLLVADLFNHRIRKVDITTGQVSTFAGSGTSGTSPGHALEVHFEKPRALARDSDGNVYVTKEGARGIRRIDVDGNVSAIVGSGAHSGNVSGFSLINSLVVNSSGELLGNDFEDHAIEKINPTATGYQLTGTAPSEPGEYVYTLKATDENGKSSETQLVINVLSKTPKLLKVERSDPTEELFTQDGSKITFKLTFDREVTARRIDFRTKEGNVETHTNSIDFPATAVENGSGEKFSKEFTVTMTVNGGFGPAELEIPENNTVFSLLHDAPMVDLTPAELNETYMIRPMVPDMSLIFNPTGREGGVGLDFVSDIVVSNQILLLRGTADKGALIKLFIKGLGSTDVYETINHTGTWRFQINTSEIGNGTRILTAQAFSNDDNNLESDVSEPKTLIFDLTPPNPPTVSMDEDTGIDDTDGITSDKELVFSGTAEANSTIEYFDGNSYSTVATTDENGNWSYSHPTILAEGEYEFSFRARDEVNNQGSPTRLDVTVDNTPPEAPEITSVAKNGGTSTTEQLINFNDVVIVGTTEKSGLVDIFLDGAQVATGVKANLSGQWAHFGLAYTGLSDGEYMITARTTDLAGNQGPETDVYTIRIDTELADPVLSPADDAVDILPDAGLTMTFAENLTLGSGNIIIRQTSDDSILETIDVNSTQVSLSGAAVTIDPDNFLPPDTEFYVTIDAGAFEDAAGNAYTGISNNTDWTFTTVAASVVDAVEVPADGTYGVGDVLEFTVNFSIPVTITGTPGIPVTVGSTLRNATLTGAVTNSSSATFSYTIVEGEVDGDGIMPGMTIDLNGGSIQDADNVDAVLTLNGVGPTTAVLVEAVRPGIVISTTDGDPTSGAFIATFDFDEPVTGFESGDISVGNGSVSGLSGSGALYTATITPALDGTVTVDVAAAAVQDLAGNDNTAASQLSIENDETAPTVSIMSLANDPINGAFEVTITFSEVVTGLDLSDFILANGTASNLTGSGTLYTATITPTTDGVITIDLDGGAMDAAGNNNTAAAQFSILADLTAPVAPLITDISDDSGSDNTDQITNDNTVLFNGTSEANSTVELFIDGASAGTTTADGSGNWTFDHSATVLPDGDYSITAIATDAATNASNLSTVLTLTIDTVTPVVPLLTAISDDTGISNTDIITNDTRLVFFGTAEPFASIAMGSGPFTLLTTTADANGDWVGDATFRAFTSSISLFITATDAAGNVSSGNNTVLIGIDTIEPVVQSIVRANPNPTTASSVDFTVTFSEEVYGLSTGNFSLDFTDTQQADVAAVSAASGTSITVTVNNITGSGTFGLNLSDLTGVMDVAGNPLGGTFTGEVYNTNFFPTDITLSAGSILENNAIDDVVAMLSTTDADAGDSHTYSLIAGVGNTDNASFSIVGDELRAAEEFDLETKSSYDIRIQTDDGRGGTFQEAFTITIDNVPEADLRITGDGNLPTTPINITTYFDITIHNDGDATLVVNSILYPAAFGGPVSGITVAPASSEVVTMTFTPPAAQMYTGDIIINTNGGTGTLAISADGDVITSIDNGLLKAEAISVYPNPASDIITIDLSGYHGRALDIQLYDMSGTKAFGISNYQDASLKLDVSRYHNGIYLVQFTDGKSTVQKKIMIRK